MSPYNLRKSVKFTIRRHGLTYTQYIAENYFELLILLSSSPRCGITDMYPLPVSVILGVKPSALSLVDIRAFCQLNYLLSPILALSHSL